MVAKILRSESESVNHQMYFKLCTRRTVASWFLCPIPPGKNTEGIVIFSGILPSQGLNPGFLHKQILGFELP